MPLKPPQRAQVQDCVVPRLVSSPVHLQAAPGAGLHQQHQQRRHRYRQLQPRPAFQTLQPKWKETSATVLTNSAVTIAGMHQSYPIRAHKLAALAVACSYQKAPTAYAAVWLSVSLSERHEPTCCVVVCCCSASLGHVAILQLHSRWPAINVVPICNSNSSAAASQKWQETRQLNSQLLNTSCIKLAQSDSAGGRKPGSQQVIAHVTLASSTKTSAGAAPATVPEAAHDVQLQDTDPAVCCMVSG